MTIEQEENRDLFDAYEDHLDGDHNQPIVIMHGCNAKGVMGSGFAKALRQNFKDSDVFDPYRNWCHTKGAGEPGSVQVLRPYTDDSVWTIIANAITQDDYGRDPDKSYAKTNWIERCIQKMDDIQWPEDTTFMAPRIGCGLGGLDWETDVRPLFEKSDLNWNIYFI